MNKKEIILLAALKLLTEKGVHDTPMSAIAKEAGTGMGTIYNYFPNKEVLINEIYLKIKKDEAATFNNFDLNKPIRAQFESFFNDLIVFFIKNPFCFQFMEQIQASPIITKENREEGLKAINPIINLLEKGKEDRIIKNIETSELIQFIGGSGSSYLRWYFRQENVKKGSFKNQIQMIWDAIKE